LQAVLPYMRQRRAGHLMAVIDRPAQSVRNDPGSIGGDVDSEGRHFFRDALEQSAERSIPDYDDSFNPIREARVRASGHQLGNPVNAARAVLAILNENKPPAHLVLGSDALRLIGDARAAVDNDIHMWETLSRTTDFPHGSQIASA
jgi:hypothetical protein